MKDSEHLNDLHRWLHNFAHKSKITTADIDRMAEIRAEIKSLTVELRSAETVAKVKDVSPELDETLQQIRDHFENRRLV